MSSNTLKEQFEKELSIGIQLFDNKAFNSAFHHFERAHILGQPHYWRHVKSHYWMLRVGLKIRI